MDQWQTLLKRFLQNECTARENKIVYHALRDGLIDDQFRIAIEIALNDTDTTDYIDGIQSVSNDALTDIRVRMLKRIKKSKEKNRKIPQWLKVAATVIITVSISWMVFHKKVDEKPTLAMNTISVPAGQTVNMILSDGTNIWLNSRSVLKYPGVFTGSRREVILDGEAYFEVAHHKDHPFVVHTNGYDIQALGTQFNVESYSLNSDFTTSLIDGSVRVTSVNDTLQNIILQPNTMVRLQDGRLISENITDFNHYRWREGLITFKDTPFADLMVKFEKCYGIRIVIENDRVKNYAPTGKFRQLDGIDYALRVLQRDFRFRFERDEEKQIIYIK